MSELSTDPNSGKDYCTVQFIGYGNEETIWVEDLLASQGEQARKEQEQRAAADNGTVAAEPEAEQVTIDFAFN